MNFPKLTNPVESIKAEAQKVTEQIQEQTTEISAAAQTQFNAVLEEYQKVLPLVETLGLSVGTFQVQLGILPEIKTSLVGSVTKINKPAVQKIIDANQSNKLLVLILNSLILTKDLQERFNITNLKGIKVDVKLGVTPNVSVNLSP